MKVEPTKTLAEIGVVPGWFCRHSGFSIWFEILTVFDAAVVCVARDPGKGVEYVPHNGGWGGIWELSAEKPSGEVLYRDRRKTFYDKCYPELGNIISQPGERHAQS